MSLSMALRIPAAPFSCGQVEMAGEGAGKPC